MTWQARAHEDRLVTEFIAHVNGAGDGPKARGRGGLNHHLQSRNVDE